MKEHHTKTKGDIGVLKVKADLAVKGYTVGSLDTEHCPFDIVAYKDNKFTRVQVKYREVDKVGKLEIRFASCWSDRNGRHSSPIDKAQVDVYAVYCPNTDCCYYFNPKDFDKSIALRVSAPLNNQLKNIKFADDFKEIP